jgi:hypothetical protein
MYVRDYLQDSENGRVDTIVINYRRYFPYRTAILSKNVFFKQITLFLLSRAMHKLLTYFSVLKPCEMTTFYRENICIKRWRLINYRQIYGVCRMIQS